MIFDRYKWVLVAIGMGYAGAIVAATPIFIPERGAVIPDTWETAPIAGVFQNPAQIASGLTRSVVRVDGSHDGMGYSQATVAMRTNWDELSLGLGVSTYGSSDLVRTARNSETSRIEESGTFGDQMQQISVVIASELEPGLRVGVNIDAISKTIDTTTGAQLGIGIGGQVCVADQWWISGYWRRAFQSPLKWGKYTEESSGGLPTIGVEYRPAFATVMGYLGENGFRLVGELPISLELSVTGAVAMGATQRYSVGTILKLGDYAVQYVHTAYPDATLDVSQDMIGVAININDGTK